ncbi:MAG TPA: hypothetical protein VJU77_17445 [Chthoniobacterales bacterium]|nr:hypothetical protein [Chthoniobacterales bacterium]
MNSTFLNLFGPSFYSDPSNWSPAQVPNNNGTTLYNVTIGDGFWVELDTDATISNLNLTGFFARIEVSGHALNVNGTTSNQTAAGDIRIISTPGSPALFNAGTFSRFANNTLSGSCDIAADQGAATFQFNGANIERLTDSYFSLSGASAKVVDEAGNDAFRDFAWLDKTATLFISDHAFVTGAPFFNDGQLNVAQSFTPSSFTAAAGLVNFDAATRTLAGGLFTIGSADPPAGPVELRFNGADIVNLASWISLAGATSGIVDLMGNDGLRNLGHILSSGTFGLGQRAITITQPFQNDGTISLSLGAVMTIAGGFSNFDPATHTLSGGTWSLSKDAQLKFAGADVVHNASAITLSNTATVTDLTGNDAFRNFNDNLSGGNFVVGHSRHFNAPGDFTNAGRIETVPYQFFLHGTLYEGRFIVSAGFRYIQSAGETVNNGWLIADQVDLLGGTFSGRGLIQGNVMVTNARFVLSYQATVNGNLTLTPESRVRYQFETYDPPLHDINGTVKLAGTLEVDIPSERFISSTQVLTILKSATPLSGVFSNAPNGGRIPTVDGKGSVVVLYSSNSVSVTQYHAEPPPSQLLNISSRVFLRATQGDPTGQESVMIGGFIIPGSVGKEVVLRGLGPSLAQFGLNPVLADPTLEVHAAGGALIASNDNWRENEAAILATGLAPSDDREAALRMSLSPGTYTVVVREKSGLAGHGLVEVYDLTQNSTSKLGNISTRGFVDATNVLIGGIIVAGSGQANAEIVARALGPTLQYSGISNPLADPTLEVRDANGVVLAFNDDCLANAQQLNSTGLLPQNNRESALRLSLPRGSYTAIVRAKPNNSGVALVEFYDLRR